MAALSPARRPVAALVLAALGLTGGCASPCARVRAELRELESPPTPAADGDHLRLAIPMALIDRVLARERERLPTARLPLPEVAGVSLGSVRVGIDRLRVVPAADGEVGMQVDVALRSGARTLLPVRLRARLRPRLDARRTQIVLALDRQGLAGLDARLGPGGSRTLADALWRQLPAPARILTSRAQISRAADDLAKRLLDQATRLVERDLLDELGKVARVEIDLPPIPVDALAVRSTGRDLLIGVHTPLPIRAAIPTKRPRVAPPHQVELTLHATAAAALVNDAMARGEIPSRFDLDGSAGADGPLLLRLAWAERDEKPLLAHAFLLDPQAVGRPARDCAHVRMGATPRVTSSRGELVIATGDAAIERVTGSVAMKTGLLFAGVTRRSFAYVEHVAVDTRFDLGLQRLRVKLEDAALRDQLLVLGLSLAPVR